MNDIDDRANNLVAAGALFAVLSGQTRLVVDMPETANQMVVRFPFLLSPYLVTIERIPEGEVE
jgi:hypothetical protein